MDELHRPGEHRQLDYRHDRRRLRRRRRELHRTHQFQCRCRDVRHQRHMLRARSIHNPRLRRAGEHRHTPARDEIRRWIPCLYQWRRRRRRPGPGWHNDEQPRNRDRLRRCSRRGSRRAVHHQRHHHTRASRTPGRHKRPRGPLPQHTSDIQRHAHGAETQLPATQRGSDVPHRRRPGVAKMGLVGGWQRNAAIQWRTRRSHAPSRSARPSDAHFKQQPKPAADLAS